MNVPKAKVIHLDVLLLAVPQSAAMAITDRPKSRPKREVGWGEVLLIVVVVIILL